MLRQLYFGFTDLALHHGYDPDGEPTAFRTLGTMSVVELRRRLKSAVGRGAIPG